MRPKNTIGILRVTALAFLLAACGGGGQGGDGGAAVTASGISAQQAYIKASNTDADDRFGFSVALSGDGNTLAVGAPAESSDATGIDGNQSSNAASQSGAVYVLVRSGATWVQQAYVKASNTDAVDAFGHSVALSSDGNTLAVGAPLEDSDATGINGDQSNSLARDNFGAVYVFTRSGSTWVQQAYVKASIATREFGWSVSLSGDGNTLAVGVPFEDSGTPASAGAAYVFTRSGATWTQQSRLVASNTDAFDEFGSSVALSGDGNTLAVGAPLEDSDATGINGDQRNSLSAVNSGAAYVFTRSGSTWTQQAYVKASQEDSDGIFGSSVALNGDGNTLAVGAPGNPSVASGPTGPGRVYVFTRSGADWTQEAFVQDSNAFIHFFAPDGFGSSVALSGDGNVLAVGASAELSSSTGINGTPSSNFAPNAGAAFVFIRSGTSWTQQTYVKASNTERLGGDAFGLVALSSDGSTLAVGAALESSDATGIDGDQSSNADTFAGAVYIFQ
jgi:hypothetical protein